MGKSFRENLSVLGFDVSAEASHSLRLVEELETSKNLEPFEVFALEDAKEFEVTAVYFRHFTDGRSPIPQIYIYDNTGQDFDDNKLAEIQRDLWSSCRIPMFIVVEKTDVEIFDAREPVKVIDGEIKPKLFDKLKITDDALKLYYSKTLFDSGIFWEKDKAQKGFYKDTSAYNDLISNLKEVRKDFINNTNLPPKTANRLLVLSILIKYLEEKGEKYAQDFFQKSDVKDFCDVLKQGKIVELFAELSRKFNGKIFEWENSAERDLIKNTNLTELALFLYGDIKLATRQLAFWRKYSFSHLPVELISSVYEEFLNNEKGAVYTPEFLVNTLIDESMPQKDYKKIDVKTIDVSCGSGIFLVSAFKRLVQRHRYKKFKDTGELRRLKSDELLQIIKENIFGIDIKEDAVHLTVFSLCLAVCEELTPKQIWDELKFDNTFQENFKTANFFEYVENKDNHEKFDLVIGNPPFVSLSKDSRKDDYLKDKDGKYYGTYKEKIFGGKKVEKKMYVNEDIVSKSKEKIFPDNQMALIFLEQSSFLLKENGLLCLIMPSAPLLYNNSNEFRKYFFPKY